MRQADDPSWWFLPGWHVERGEWPEAALARELAEELGTEARIGGRVAVVEHSHSDRHGQHHQLNVVFEAAIHEVEPRSREDHLEVAWLAPDELAQADVRPAALKELLTSGATAARS